MLNNLLLAVSLGFCLVAFFVFEGLDFVILCKSLDQFGLEFPGIVARVMTSVAAVSRRTHSADCAALSARKAVGIEHVGTTISRLLGEHHEPLVVFFSVVFLVTSCFVPSHIDVLNGSKVGTTICLDNDEIADTDLQACTLLDEEHIGTAALEVDNVQRLN
jgi:hypothetical protein